jgi:hypothetical protein
MEPGPRTPILESVEGWKKNNVKALFFPFPIFESELLYVEGYQALFYCPCVKQEY